MDCGQKLGGKRSYYEKNNQTKTSKIWFTMVTYWENKLFKKNNTILNSGKMVTVAYMGLLDV